MRKLTLLASALILPLTITACDYEGLPFGNKKAQKDETSTSTDGSEANGGPVAMTGADEQAESSAPPPEAPRLQISDITQNEWFNTRIVRIKDGEPASKLPVTENNSKNISDTLNYFSLFGSDLQIGVFTGSSNFISNSIKIESINNCTSKNITDNGSAFIGITTIVDDHGTRELPICIDIISLIPINESDVKVLTLRFNGQEEHFINKKDRYRLK